MHRIRGGVAVLLGGVALMGACAKEPSPGRSGAMGSMMGMGGSEHPTMQGGAAMHGMVARCAGDGGPMSSPMMGSMPRPGLLMDRDAMAENGGCPMMGDAGR